MPAVIERVDEIERLFRMMVGIRAFEKGAARLQAENLLSGTLHLSLGQEAVAAGVCSRLLREDYITATHRGHGHCLAKGADPGRMFAELLGRSTGYCRGRSGSMHIADPSTGNLGANAIVGGGVPMAVGAALSAQTFDRPLVSVAFFGDGAVSEGVVWECLNIATLWSLPIVFVCEHNGFVEMLPTHHVLGIEKIADIGRLFGMKSETVDGNDVLEVASAAHAAAAHARAGKGPVFLEARTYRRGGHYEGDPGSFRDAENAAAWALRDPLLLTETRLLAQSVAKGRIEEIKNEADVEMWKAIEWAREEPPAEAASLTEDVYSAEVAAIFAAHGGR